MPEALGLDPRTKILTVVVVSAAVMGVGGSTFILAGLLLAVGLAVAERAWLRVAVLPVVVGLLSAAAFWLPTVWRQPAAGVMSIAAFYAVRLAVAIGVGMHVVATVSPTRLAAAFRAWRVPRALSVSTSVMLRFFPIVAAEASAVFDAMKLRGLAGMSGFFRHPILAIERFTVPMIASSLRVGEDLSASALLRGLGSPHRPTSMVPARFTWRDPAFALVVAAFAAGSLALWPVTT